MIEKNIFEIGFVKLSKLMLEWQWYGDPVVSRLYIHILLKSNYKRNRWQGIDIDVGEFVTSVDKLHVELSLSIQKVRTALKKLQRTGYIVIKPTNRFTLIKLVDSDVFTLEFTTSNKPVIKQKTYLEQPTNNEATTTNKEKKENNFKEEIELFQAELDEYKNIYSKETLIPFFTYWTEENRQTGRPKFLDEEYWNIKARLSSWKSYPKTENKKSFIKNRNYDNY